MRRAHWIAVSGLSLCVSGASAQPTGTYLIDYEYGHGGVVSPSDPTVTVRISVARGGVGFAFARSVFDLLADDGSWTIVDYGGLEYPRSSNPRGEGTNRLMLSLLQWNTPSPWPIFVIANQADPIHILTARWTADTFARRDVGVLTETKQMAYYLQTRSFANEPLIPIELRSSIRVIPSSGTIACLVGLSAWFRRSRGKRAASGE